MLIQKRLGRPAPADQGRRNGPLCRGVQPGLRHRLLQADLARHNLSRDCLNVGDDV